MRTGVTAILPRGMNSIERFAFARLVRAENGNGEMTGTTWVDESGFLEGPVMITNTHSVGVVRDAVIAWRVAHGPRGRHRRLVVAAGGRGDLGRVAERHQRVSRQAPSTPCRRSTVHAAGRCEEGNVGGGTGMICNGFKGGIGTASRKLTAKRRRLHARRAGAVQLRHARKPAHCGHPGRA